MADEDDSRSPRSFSPFFRPTAEGSPSASPTKKIKLRRVVTFRLPTMERDRQSAARKQERKKIHPFFARQQQKPQAEAGKSGTGANSDQPQQQQQRSGLRRPSEALWPDKDQYCGGHLYSERRIERGANRSSTCPWTDRIPRVDLHEMVVQGADSYFKKMATRRGRGSPRTMTRSESSMHHYYYFSESELRNFIAAVYPSSKNSTACQALLDSIFSSRDPMRQRSNGNMATWTEKYRPHQVANLLGNGEDYAYLRRWLEQMKVAGPLNAQQTHDGHSTRKRRRSFSEEDRAILEFLGCGSGSHDPAAEEDDAFMSGRYYSRSRRPETMESNLILLVGKFGVGKTAAVYTAAEEAGYEVFELNPGMRRSGKDIIASVGEMTESHLVNFDGAAASSQSTEGQSETKHEKKSKTQKHKTKENGDKATSKSAGFMRQFAQGTTKKRKIAAPEASTDSSILNDNQSAVPPSPKAQEALHKPKQSLVLLEEVDLLYEEDKRFWSAVADLAAKSKRPIVMTCNDIELVPVDLFFFQAILRIGPPPVEELLAYLQLVCFAEGLFIHPVDLAGIYAVIGNDLRQLIHTLELWCAPEAKTPQESQDDGRRAYLDCGSLFERYAGISQGDEPVQARLFHLQPRTMTTGIDLARYYERCSSFMQRNKKKVRDRKEEELDTIVQAMDTASFQDAWVGVSALRDYQMHECDEYHRSLDQRMGLATIWKEPSNVDHWRVELDILAAIDMLNSLRIDTDQWRGEIADSVWDSLLDKRLKVTRESITAAGNLLPLRTRFNAKIAMTEYLPNIRSLCQYDQGIAGRGRALRSRQKRRYLPLSDEKRQKLVGDGLEENKTTSWYEQTKIWNDRCQSATKEGRKRNAV